MGVETLSSWPVPFALLFLCLQRGGAGRLIIRSTSEEGWQLAVGEQDGMSNHKPLVMGRERPPREGHEPVGVVCAVNSVRA